MGDVSVSLLKSTTPLDDDAANDANERPGGTILRLATAVILHNIRRATGATIRSDTFILFKEERHYIPEDNKVST